MPPIPMQLALACLYLQTLLLLDLCISCIGPWRGRADLPKEAMLSVDDHNLLVCMLPSTIFGNGMCNLSE